MTNREKFVQMLKETFGEENFDSEEIKGHTLGCEMLKCNTENCKECPFDNFWKQEYKGKEEGGYGK